MRNFKGGETVKAGFYWNRGAWDVSVVPAEGSTLPGTPETAFLRVPWPLLLVIAPIMGGTFAMFLPFIGLAMLVQFGWKAVIHRVSRRDAARI
jgi:hypothetical protein